MNNQGFQSDKGEVFIYLSSIPIESFSLEETHSFDWLFSTVLEYNSALVILPMRFFSNKYNELKNLQYLSTDQMIEDILKFIQTGIRKPPNSISEQTKFVLIGDSYFGSIAIYLKNLNPQLITAVIAINPVEFYSPSALDEIVFKELQKQTNDANSCQQSIQKFYAAIESLFLNSVFQGYLKQFSQMKQLELLSMLSNMIIIIIEKKGTNKLCPILSDSQSDPNQLLDKISTLYEDLTQSLTPIGLFSSNEIKSSKNPQFRSTVWFHCRELKTLIAVANEIHPIMSPLINQEAFFKFCGDSFGQYLIPTNNDILDIFKLITGNLNDVIIISYSNMFIEKAKKKIPTNQNDYSILIECISCDLSWNRILFGEEIITDSNIELLTIRQKIKDNLQKILTKVNK